MIDEEVEVGFMMVKDGISINYQHPKIKSQLEHPEIQRNQNL
ncbi:MAG: hypothetical protein ACXWFB_09270 [Nitrososphaeraceae archaeon]